MSGPDRVCIPDSQVRALGRIRNIPAGLSGGMDGTSGPSMQECPSSPRGVHDILGQIQRFRGVEPYGVVSQES